MIRKLWAFVVVLFIISLILGLFVAIADAKPDKRLNVPLVQQGVHVIGDSTVAGPHRTVLKNPPPGWTSDGQGGRKVTSLMNGYIAPTDGPERLRHIFAPTMMRDEKVSTIAFGLGANGDGTAYTVNQAVEMYAHAIQLIRSRNIWKPGIKRIVLIAPYRSPDVFTEDSPIGFRASDVDKFRQAVYRIAKNSGGVCVADWAGLVERKPWLLHDGVHATGEGRHAWSSLLRSTINGCYA